MIGFHSIRFLLIALSFLFIAMPSEAAEEIDRETIRTQLGIELKDFYEEVSKQTFISVSPATYGLGEDIRPRKFSHFELSRKASNLSQKIEDQKLILGEFKNTQAEVKDVTAGTYGGHKFTIEALFLEKHGYKDFRKFRKAIIRLEENIKSDQRALVKLNGIQSTSGWVTQDAITFEGFRNHIQKHCPSLMVPALRAATLEEVRSLLE